MKSERRHQLQANELARHLETFPEKLKRNATSIMLGITVVVVIFVFMRYRRQAAVAREASVSNALSAVRQLPPNIALMDQGIGMGPPDQIAQGRKQVIDNTNTAIDTLLREADGDHANAMKAEALVARGDLNWFLANAHPLPGATTQPALALPRQRDDYLGAAENAYRDVVNGYKSESISWVTAQFGLGAVAENRGDWNGARRIYGEILANKDVAETFRQSAQLRLNVLEQIQKPMLIGTYPQGGAAAPSTQPGAAPSTQPAVSPSPAPAPATQPTSQPTSQPAS